MAIGDQEKYAAAVQLIEVSENTSINRFNAYLVFSAILAAGWVQLFSQQTPVPLTEQVMYAVGVIGVLSGLYWAGLGTRSRGYVQTYREIAEQHEGAAAAGGGDRTLTDPCFAADPKRYKKRNKRLAGFLETNTGATALLYYGPLLLSGLFALSIWATRCKFHP